MPPSHLTMFPLVLRLLLYMYTHHKLQVNWSDHISNMFSVSNGVEQNGVLSLISFSVYLDGLLTKLNKKGVGFHMGNYVVGCLAYVDDLTLIAHQEKLYKSCLVYVRVMLKTDVILMVLKVVLF